LCRLDFLRDLPASVLANGRQQTYLGRADEVMATGVEIRSARKEKRCFAESLLVCEWGTQFVWVLTEYICRLHRRRRQNLPLARGKTARAWRCHCPKAMAMVAGTLFPKPTDVVLTAKVVSLVKSVVLRASARTVAVASSSSVR